MPLRGWVDEVDFAKHEEWMANGKSYQLHFTDVRYRGLNLEGFISKGMERLSESEHDLYD